MKFSVKNKSGENTQSLMRELGYHFWGQKKETGEKETGEMAFIRPIRGIPFPRFHIYLKKENKTLVFNLHFDQKRPIYKGTPAHSADYDGEVLEKEKQRIKQFIMRGIV